MHTRQMLGLFLALLVIGIGPLAFGQSSASAQSGTSAATEATAQEATAARKGEAVRSGTKIDAALESSLDARTAKPGDRVEARVLKNVKQDGRVVVHKGDRLVGRVTAAKAAATKKSASEIAVAFDRLESEQGETRLNTVLSSIVSVNSQQDAGLPDSEPMMEPMPAGGGAVRGGGLLGGAGAAVGSTAGATEGAAGSVAGGAGSTLGGAGGTLNAATGSSAGAGLNTGLATPVRDIHIDSGAQAQNQTGMNSVLITRHGDLRLESGTHMQFRVAAKSTAHSR
jgi:hypothetical protein